jgi:CDP-glucose 4,6-dehydratase
MLDIADLEDVYRDRRVLVTGHTGFKGSWLTLWLDTLGAHVTGLSLAPPSNPNHWELLRLDVDEQYADVREAEAVADVFTRTQPECVVHLAAQPLVRRSYVAPADTWSTNVVGTVNVLEACRSTASVRAVVVATTDKCYENVQTNSPYREDDRLGGHDPYSASKAAVELVAASYRTSFFTMPESPLLATARAGNVIGGGDWGEDRLIPDFVRARMSGVPLAVRSPGATRPWQHVLDCLAGYLVLGANLLSNRRDLAGAWNFGPDANDTRSVADVLTALQRVWPGLHSRNDVADRPHEAPLLSLDSTRARTLLGWRPAWSIDDALNATASWYRRFLEDGTVSSHEQLDAYIASAHGGATRVAIP